MNLIEESVKSALRLNPVMTYDTKERTRKAEQDRKIRRAGTCSIVRRRRIAFVAQQRAAPPKN